jgi:hypothetical protein
MKTWRTVCKVHNSSDGVKDAAMNDKQDDGVIIFVNDNRTMEALPAKHFAQIDAQLELTVSPFCHVGKWLSMCPRVAGGQLLPLLTQREHLSAGWPKGPKLAPVNSSILYKPGGLTVPAYKVIMLNDIQDTLNKLQEGATAKPDAAKEAKK